MPDGADGSGTEPYLYAPASQFPLTCLNAPTLSCDNGDNEPVLILIRLEAALIATEPDKSWPRLPALILEAGANFEWWSQWHALCQVAKVL